MKSSTEAEKCKAVLYIIGEEGRKIHNTWTLSEEERDKVQPLLKKFKEYCTPRNNTTLERYKFNSRVQKPDETVDQFVVDLRQMAKTCQFGVLEEDMVRDRIVVGIYSKTMKERLLRESDLTFKIALDLCRAAEQSKSGLAVMDEKVGAAAVDALRKQKLDKSFKNKKASNEKCKKCLLSHPPRKCPAFGKKCLGCGKYNHFRKACRTESKKKKLHQVDKDYCESDYSESDLEEHFQVGEVTKKSKDSDKETEWKINLGINGKNTLTVKVDTGAQVNVISKREVNRLGAKIRSCNDRQTSYSGDPIPVEGQIELVCKYKKQQKKMKFVVTSQNEAQTIIGLKSSVDLKLIKKLDAVQQNKSLEALLRQYNDTFGELGKMKTEYAMKVKDDVEPIVSTARKIPYAQREKVLNELKRMEKLEVIVKEDGPTEWVNPIIVVNKPNGQVRICMDPQRLNQALKREYYQIPTVEEISSKMTGACYYSKLDASSGF
ncbi:transposon ty3-i Gag-Pol polyprotein [Plakobranchus ocellatus]|uniref:Transposon ty3-i Gag-Pol polyprotein n=1 Tax=Plakobranchus ocellatus TaxID=259542 RepID=A0AAV4D8Q4_9GAST|nr:transposon ty3-i Gag-Pol polyprotein [Plakobranchus ocellatus]